MLIRRATEGFRTKEYKDTEGRTAVQHFLLNPGEYEGKLNSYVRATLNPGFELYFHVHQDCEEIFVILSGAAKYLDKDKNEYILHAGDVMVCNCGEGHTICNPFNEPVIVMELNLPVEK